MPLYSNLVLDHVLNPRNAGQIPDANAYAEITNPACGDIMKLWLRFNGDRIAEAKYHTYGCPASVAASSILSEWLTGRSLSEAKTLTRKQFAEIIGMLPNDKRHAIALVVDCLGAALASAGQN